MMFFFRTTVHMMLGTNPPQNIQNLFNNWYPTGIKLLDTLQKKT